MKLAQRLGITRYEADEHYRAALHAFSARDFAKAKAEINLALELLPNHAEYHATLGFLLLDGKDVPAATEAFERTLALNPYEMLANYGQGMIAYRAKDWTSASGYFMDAFAAQPSRAETQYYLAMVSHRLGKNGEAIHWMEEAAKQFSNAEDRRERHCLSWIREFEKLL